MLDFISDNIAIASVVLIVLAVAGMVLAVAKRWKIARPDEAFIITGLKGKGGEATQKIKIGEGFFHMPFVQELSVLSLRNQDIQIEIPNAITKDKIPVRSTLVALLKVQGTEQGVRLAAQRYLGQEERIKTTSQEVLTGAVRSIVGEMTVQEILEDRKTFEEKVRQIAESTFGNQGLVIESLTIKEINDDNDYINDLGRPEIARIKAQARVDEAQSEQRATEAQAASEIKIAQQRKEVELEKARIQAETEKIQAEAKQSGPLAQAKAEREVLAEQELATRARAAVVAAELEITVNKQADAERYEQLQRAQGTRDAEQAEAEADAIKVKLDSEAKASALKIQAESEAGARTAHARAEAEAIAVLAKAEADATSARGDAEASAILAKGLAEAEAMKKKADAYKEYGEAAITEIVANMVPDALRANAEAYSNISNVTVFDGLTGFGKDIAGNGAQINETVKQLFGLDLPAALSGFLGGNLGAKQTTGVAVPTVVADADTETPWVNASATVEE